MLICRPRGNAANAPSSRIQGFGADVVTIEHPRCVEVVDDRIDLVLCGFDVGRGGFDEEDAAGVGDEAFVGVGDAGIVDVGVFADGDFGDVGAFDDVDGVAVGGEDDAEGGVVLIPGEGRGVAVEDGPDACGEVAGELGKYDFGFSDRRSGR